MPGDTRTDLDSRIYLTGDSAAGEGGWVRVAGSGGGVPSSLRALAEARVSMLVDFGPRLRGYEETDGEGLVREGTCLARCSGIVGVGRMFSAWDGPGDPNMGSWEYLLRGYDVRPEGPDRT